MQNNLRRHTLMRGECPLHYYTSDPYVEGRIDLVLIHGTAVDHNSFSKFIELLPEDTYNLLLPELRGHGKSQPVDVLPSFELITEDILAVLEDAGVQKALFIGQGVGGAIVQDILYQQPDRVIGMGILGCGCNYIRPSGFEKLTFSVMNGIVSHYAFNKLRKNLAFSTSALKEGREYTHRCITKMQKMVILRYLQITTRPTHRDKKFVSEVNGFAAMGFMEMPRLGKKLVNAYRQHLPNVDLYQVPRAASLVQYDAPTHLADLLERLRLKIYDPKGYKEAMERYQKEYEKEMKRIMEKRQKEEEARRKEREEQKKARKKR
ncbi:MAG: alpha/beta fold hydrolase [Eubacteriales bacterium]|jgi:3-oxoadipate enol-lactonase